MPSKTDLQREIKNVRQQMVTLEKRCQEREDRMLKVLLSFEPFLPALSEAAQRELLNSLPD